MKYPWPSDDRPYAEYPKYGVYRTEMEDFEWVRQGTPDKWVTLEAQIMDWADDITYSVHDLEDFFQAGLIDPAVLRDTAWMDRELDRWMADLEKGPGQHRRKKQIADAIADLDERFFSAWVEIVLGRLAYRDNHAERASIRFQTSRLIGRFLRALSLVKDSDGRIQLEMGDGSDLVLMKFFQRVVRSEVIENPQLAMQQRGLKEVVSELFEAYLEAIRHESRRAILPPVFRKLAEEMALAGTLDEYQQHRLAADAVANLTDQEALAMYHRITGISPSSVFESLPR